MVPVTYRNAQNYLDTLRTSVIYAWNGNREPRMDRKGELP